MPGRGNNRIKGKQHRLSEAIQTTPGAGRCAAGDEGGGQTEEAPRDLRSQSPDAGSLGEQEVGSGIFNIISLGC